MAVLIFLGCLLGGIAIGLPIAWALLLCGAALMFWLDMFDVQIMAQTLVNGADSFSTGADDAQRQLPGQPGGGADCLWRHYRANYSPFHSVYYLRRFQRIIHQ